MTRPLPDDHGTDSPSTDLDGDPGARVLGGRYVLDRLLGRGGMAEVRLGWDRDLGRSVAVKLLAPEYAADPSYRQRLQEEARAAAVLNHANVVAVHDVGIDDDEVFVVMEYVEGRTLRAATRDRSLPVGEVLDVGAAVCSALDAAHARGIVHRDVTPANIFLGDDGTVKLGDFGIARRVDRAGHTVTNQILGTVAYMSPEQIRGQPLDGRSDVYSVGCVLYELLAGARPFDGGSTLEVASRRLTEAPRPLGRLAGSLPGGLEGVVTRAMAREVADRPATASDLGSALRRCRSTTTDPDTTGATAVTVPEPRRGRADHGSGDEDALTAADSRAPQPGDRDPWARLRRLGIGLIVVAVLVLLGAAAVLMLR